jgi:hypothetical protein
MFVSHRDFLTQRINSLVSHRDHLTQRIKIPVVSQCINVVVPPRLPTARGINSLGGGYLA